MIPSSIPWWIESLLFGILSGLVCSLIIWFVRPIPRLKVCNRIAHNKEGKSYHFKIQNIGRDNVSITSIFITLLYKGQFYTIKGIEIPLLHSQHDSDRLKTAYSYERIIPIDVLRIKLDTLQKTQDPELITKHEFKNLTLNDFIEKDEQFKIFVGISAINCKYNTSHYYLKSLSTSIEEGKYIPGKDYIEIHDTPFAD